MGKNFKQRVKELIAKDKALRIQLNVLEHIGNNFCISINDGQAIGDTNIFSDFVMC